MGEGNIFTLFVHPHLRGGVHHLHPIIFRLVPCPWGYPVTGSRSLPGGCPSDQFQLTFGRGYPNDWPKSLPEVNPSPRQGVPLLYPCSGVPQKKTWPDRPGQDRTRVPPARTGLTLAHQTLCCFFCCEHLQDSIISVISMYEPKPSHVSFKIHL